VGRFGEQCVDGATGHRGDGGEQLGAGDVGPSAAGVGPRAAGGQGQMHGVLLILPPSECRHRLEANGIRIEKLTMDCRKAECMRKKMGWETSEDKKPYNRFARELQIRVRKACYPDPRARHRRHL
jgi:hypothetical protein